MISRSDIPRRGRILEIAIVFSIALHLVLGSLATYKHTTVSKMLQRLLKQEKEDKYVALSTTITIEKRTVPRSAPQAQPQPKTVQPQPRVVQRQAQLPAPVTKPVPREVPIPHAEPTEIAKIVPKAKEHVETPSKPKVLAYQAVPHKNSNQFSAQQLAEMQQRFSDTIAQARAESDPTHVTSTAPPATMKHAHLDVTGINELLAHGEGILTPQSATLTNVDGDPRGACYYVNFEVNFSDGSFDSGPVYWPICYTSRQDPFRNYFRHFPLPGPPPGWQPSSQQWPVIAAHKVLRAYFPDRFPDADNGN
jgi:outer membrane biosynthesis protein TonB